MKTFVRTKIVKSKIERTTAEWCDIAVKLGVSSTDANKLFAEPTDQNRAELVRAVVEDLFVRLFGVVPETKEGAVLHVNNNPNSPGKDLFYRLTIQTGLPNAIAVYNTSCSITKPDISAADRPIAEELLDHLQNAYEITLSDRHIAQRLLVVSLTR